MKMRNGKVVVFLVAGVVFAIVHKLALTMSLYWYYWWFDIVMHFWGGILIGVGVHALSTFSVFRFKPTAPVLLVVLAVMTGVWEVFEWFADLYNTSTYVLDTTQDVLLGFSGGLIAHVVLQRYTIK